MGLLDNQIVVVTGGAGKIGSTFIKAIVEEGGVGVIAEVNKSFADQVVEEIKSEYQDAIIEVVELDINDKPSVQACINTLDSKYGRIDALINCAYPRTETYAGVRFEEMEYHEFCAMINMNLGGYFLTSQQFINYFKTKEKGKGVVLEVKKEKARKNAKS